MISGEFGALKTPCDIRGISLPQKTPCEIRGILNSRLSFYFEALLEPEKMFFRWQHAMNRSHSHDLGEERLIVWIKELHELILTPVCQLSLDLKIKKLPILSIIILTNLRLFYSAKCGGGKQRRERSCDSPSPKYKGDMCMLSDGELSQNLFEIK